ncbi:flagellar M-ring protein FliF C-terminal domain-containing protein [Acidisoma sp. 7E03]
MPDWRKFLAQIQGFAARVPRLAWAAGGVVGLALALTLYLEMSGPGYAALYEGLTPAEGGKVIAALQKLGIPYQLRAAGNIILVPSDQLAAARLQLGAQQLPGTTAASAWDKVESAPMTASDLAQTTMATQALQASLQATIEGLNGVRSAEVFLATPRDTPFLADQPKPSAAVIIDAADSDAETLGPAIAHLVAGAVPGLEPAQISVTTTNGVRAYPVNDSKTSTATQFSTIALVESDASQRVSRLLAPILGTGHYRIAASADVDFTQSQTHETLYGPGQMVSREDRRDSTQIGAPDLAMGIPGALSNEPPAATAATAPTIPPTTAQPPPATPTPPAGTTGAAGTAAATVTKPETPPEPRRTTSSSSQAYLTDTRVSDINPPEWRVSGLAISAVLDQAALKGTDPEQIRALIAAAFSYPKVAVHVLVAPFGRTSALAQPFQLQQSIGPLSQAILEVLAALALLFGLALPLGRRIGSLTPPRRLLALPAAASSAIPAAAIAAAEQIAGPIVPSRVEYTGLREEAAKNVAGVARLLQDWAERHE